MPKIIGIVGSRRRNESADFYATLKAFQKVYEPGDRIVSGACPQGGDRFAELIALQLAAPGHYSFEELWKMPSHQRLYELKVHGAPIILHPAKWREGGRYNPAAGFERNGLIARDADVLIACVAKDRTGGTEDTIAKFLRAGKHKEDLILC